MAKVPGFQSEARGSIPALTWLKSITSSLLSLTKQLYPIECILLLVRSYYTVHVKPMCIQAVSSMVCLLVHTVTQESWSLAY